jgi:hypothetical protein
MGVTAETEGRRNWRTAIHGATAIALLFFIWMIIEQADQPTVEWIAKGSIVILFVREFLHGTENVTARVKFGVGKDGVTGEVDPGRE